MHRPIPRPIVLRDLLADYALLATGRLDPFQSPPPAAHLSDSADGPRLAAQNGHVDASDAAIAVAADRQPTADSARRRPRRPYMYTSRLGGRR